MNFWILIPSLILAAIVQIAWLPALPIWGYKIDLALVLVVSWGLLSPIGQAAQWGFILGIMLDLASGLPFGIHTVTLTLIGLAVGWGQAVFFRGNLVAPPMAMILATLLDHLLILAWLALFNRQINLSDYLLRITLPTAILNTAVAPLFYFPLQWLQRRSHPQIEF
jgi:rod shape-determining protein MreD